MMWAFNQRIIEGILNGNRGAYINIPIEANAVGVCPIIGLSHNFRVPSIMEPQIMMDVINLTGRNYPIIPRPQNSSTSQKRSKNTGRHRAGSRSSRRGRGKANRKRWANRTAINKNLRLKINFLIRKLSCRIDGEDPIRKTFLDYKVDHLRETHEGREGLDHLPFFLAT